MFVLLWMAKPCLCETWGRTDWYEADMQGELEESSHSSSRLGRSGDDTDVVMEADEKTRNIIECWRSERCNRNVTVICDSVMGILRNAANGACESLGAAVACWPQALITCYSDTQSASTCVLCSLSSCVPLGHLDKTRKREWSKVFKGGGRRGQRRQAQTAI